MSHSDNLKKAEKGAWISIFAYIILAIAKLIIAYKGNSDALRADGLNNSTDVIASIAVLVGLKISRKPPDEDHHYGHFRAETVASLFAAFIMMFVGLQVIFDTCKKVWMGNYSQPDMITAWTALGAACIMLLVYLYNVRLSRKIESSSLYAAAQDNRSDALVSIGAFIGIIGAQFGLFWLDPLAGLIVGLIICKTAWDIFKDSTHTLTDGFDEKQIKKIRTSIEKDSEVKELIEVKGRIHGNQAFIDITILVDPTLNVEESHAITERLENHLYKKHNITHAHIHIEPYKK
ncbi:cation diffusion facilitator family transporter [Virgibacillus sp. AGTR]|uniref:Cation transporter n=1 Tax=Virgibacillus salarius TaxID=447199 RepID=A0A941DYD9_9BACI|nr:MULTISPECIES: cation diffusion facilitator family transporter [Bacillaceae]NAZ10670.1 cation diffusion facilitator family transporter [Agaribacter marinus]MBR7797961.1 cation transporter [Virgibacillus salarius]MCC2252707.1 cation diffusion facilitator family transporter [Virgibacillus sp. AGTR]MDY7045205.1 cation diffusion facilitator family transporter [Virgibacillus sp. M23]QRZ16437.1 cation transporter [Virgibacillus sp. AGTR]